MTGRNNIDRHSRDKSTLGPRSDERSGWVTSLSLPPFNVPSKESVDWLRPENSQGRLYPCEKTGNRDAGYLPPEKFVRLSGPSGSLRVLAHWMHWENDLYTMNCRIPPPWTPFFYFKVLVYCAEA